MMNENKENFKSVNPQKAFREVPHAVTYVKRRY